MDIYGNKLVSFRDLKLLYASSSNLADTLTILEVKGQGYEVHHCQMWVAWVCYALCCLVCVSFGFHGWESLAERNVINMTDSDISLAS